MQGHQVEQQVSAWRGYSKKRMGAAQYRNSSSVKGDRNVCRDKGNTGREHDNEI